MDIYYINSSGEKVILNKWPCMIQNQEELMEYEWQSEIKETGNHIETILGFYMKIKEKKITLSIFAETREEFIEIFNKMHEIFEKDITRKAPGKLFVGNTYISCYCNSGKIEDYEEDFYASDYQIGILPDFPLWIKEEMFSFEKYSENSEEDFLDFPFDFQYDFTAGQKGNSELNINHYTDSNFKMIIYGPVVDPQVLIGGYSYQIFTIIEENEYLTIDSKEGTVIKTQADGTQVNEFDSRDFENSVFRKIPNGRLNVNWSGDFGFDITIYKERSKP